MFRLKRNLFREKVGSLLRYIYWKLENSNNTDFEKNGEKKFLDLLFKYYKSKGENNLVIFDVGANMGKYSELILANGGLHNIDVLLHLFEPQKTCFDELMKNFSDLSNVIINNFGLSDSETEEEIFYDERGSGLASLYKRDLSHYSMEFSSSEIIQIKRLDSYIENKKIHHIHLLKLDVEGHEINVLRGLGSYLDKSFLDFIQFEYGGANIDSRTFLRDFFSMLVPKGFKIAKIMPKGLEILKYKSYYEDFQYKNFVAISEMLI